MTTVLTISSSVTYYAGLMHAQALKQFHANLTACRRMGMAQVTCVAGCRCEGNSIFDGHTDIHASYPWPGKISAVLLDDADGVEGFCVVQLKVLDETQAPDHQHKVKVLQLVVSVEQDRSQELLELRHRLAQQRH